MNLVAVTQDLGHLPSPEEIDEHAEFRAKTYEEEFGNLYKALDQTGMVPNGITQEVYRQATESQKASTGVSSTEPSRAKLIEELQRIDDELDHIPYPVDMNKDGSFSAKTYQERFRSWNTALKVAGIDKEQALLEDMRRVSEMVKGDIQQFHVDEHGLYSSKMISQHFGNWDVAKERFYDWNKDQQTESSTSKAFENKVSKRLNNILR